MYDDAITLIFNQNQFGLIADIETIDRGGEFDAIFDEATTTTIY